MPVPASSILPLLADLKAQVNVSSATHDTELEDMLAAAVEVVEGYIGPLDGSSVTETHYGRNPGLPLLLHHHPVQSVTSVTDANGDVLDPDTYTVDLDTGRVWLSRWSGALNGWSFWGARMIDVTVTYTTGRTTLPAAVRLAILIVAARLWETQRGSAPSALPVADDSGLTVDPSGLPLLPPRAQELLRPYLHSQSSI